MSSVFYKTQLPRLLSSGAPVTVGKDLGLLQAIPFGRPQVLKELKVYTEVMQESQAGLDSETETMRSRPGG